jgi:hypothetical protein
VQHDRVLESIALWEDEYKMVIEDKSRLLEVLDNALNQATSTAIKNADPIKRSKNSTFIGTTIVEKNRDGFYDIKFLNDTILFENISTFDVAVMIAQRYNSNEHSVIKQILVLEEKYAKYHNDMVHYLHCFKAAKKKNDIEKMCILEDKFQVAEGLARITKDRIGFFKRVKYAF